MIRCAAAERTFVAVYQISWLLTLDSRGRAEINYFRGETYSVCMPHKAVEGGVGPHTTHTVHLLMKLVSPKMDMVEKPRNLFKCVANWTNQITSFDLGLFVLLQT